MVKAKMQRQTPYIAPQAAIAAAAAL